MNWTVSASDTSAVSSLFLNYKLKTTLTLIALKSCFLPNTYSILYNSIAHLCAYIIQPFAELWHELNWKVVCARTQISFEEGNVSFCFPSKQLLQLTTQRTAFLFVSANNLNVFRKSTPDFTTAQPPPSLTQSYFPIFVSLNKVGRFERGKNGPARTLCKMENPRMYRKVILFPSFKRQPVRRSCN